MFLIDQGLLDIPVLYLSGYIIQNKTAYYQRLLQVTLHQQWEAWIIYMLEAVKETAVWTREKITAIHDLMEETTALVRVQLPAIYSRELIELLFMQPYCRIANMVEGNIAKRQTASRYLKLLCEVGVLKEIKSGREKIFVNPALMRLLRG